MSRISMQHDHDASRFPSRFDRNGDSINIKDSARARAHSTVCQDYSPPSAAARQYGAAEKKRRAGEEGRGGRRRRRRRKAERDPTNYLPRRGTGEGEGGLVRSFLISTLLASCVGRRGGGKRRANVCSFCLLLPLSVAIAPVPPSPRGNAGRVKENPVRTSRDSQSKAFPDFRELPLGDLERSRCHLPTTSPLSPPSKW